MEAAAGSGEAPGAVEAAEGLEEEEAAEVTGATVSAAKTWEGNVASRGAPAPQAPSATSNVPNDRPTALRDFPSIRSPLVSGSAQPTWARTGEFDPAEGTGQAGSAGLATRLRCDLK
ncbi:hypothetical protein AB870_07340 [Pandoraea faecigallinarum]|uniref:Uncharacterized protein n=1 Tax=Pandoraea faecigallinarum TaxID=656179 RepID=A0A0H3WTT7_9BURK|nr:hypothetical protein AB870_07340 [Pandoraea faecigallinarum]